VTTRGLEGNKGHMPLPAGLSDSTDSVSACHALAWRPRHVVLGQGPYDGRVKGVSYLGEAVEYLIDCAAGTVKAQTPTGEHAHAQRWAVEAPVRFDLPLAQAVQLQSD
jgi:putative spermidine/putrescine transport system ATP-binding protein